MKITVAQLLERCPAGTEVLVDAGLQRPIRWVHPTEIADPSGYLEGGEVILTAGVWIEAGTSPATAVQRLSEAGVAAVGFGLTRQHETVPAKMVKACERFEISLFSVPVDVPFLAIMGEFVDAMSKEREAPLQDAIRRTERFLRVSGESDPAGALLRAISCYCRGNCYLVDALGEVLASSAGPPDRSEAEAVNARLAAAAAGGAPGIFAVPPGRTSEGWLVILSDQNGQTAEERAVIDQSLPFLALAFARRRALSESHRRFSAELVDLLLAGESMAQAARARLEAFRMDLDEGLVAVVARGEDDQAVLETLELAYREHGLRATVTTKRGEVVSIVQADRPEAEFGDFLEVAWTKLKERGQQRTAIGYGQVARDVADLRKSLVEAQHACLVAGSRDRGGCASYAQVGSHALLIALQDRDVLGHFQQAILEPLEEHDARSQVSLIETLDAFLNSNGKWRETAKALYIHVNTLRHRLGNVERLTGRDLSSMSDRVDFFIALRAREREASIA